MWRCFRRAIYATNALTTAIYVHANLGDLPEWKASLGMLSVATWLALYFHSTERGE